MTRRLVEPIGEGTPGTEPGEVRDELPTGFRVGPYRLLGVLGSGGMATVYLASLERGSFQKIIALKRIHPHLARDGTMRRMFADEARIASQIAHPNVCQVFDVGEADGVPFLAMEYVQGETVDRIGQALVRLPDLRRNPRFWCFIARIITDAAEGLSRGARGHRTEWCSARGGASRHQTQQPHRVVREPYPRHGFRHRARDGSRARDTDRRAQGKPRVHGTRASGGTTGRPTGRCMEPGGGALGAACRPRAF